MAGIIAALRHLNQQLDEQGADPRRKVVTYPEGWQSLYQELNEARRLPRTDSVSPEDTNITVFGMPVVVRDWVKPGEIYIVPADLDPDNLPTGWEEETEPH